MRNLHNTTGIIVPLLFLIFATAAVEVRAEVNEDDVLASAQAAVLKQSEEAPAARSRLTSQEKEMDSFADAQAAVGVTVVSVPSHLYRATSGGFSEVDQSYAEFLEGGSYSKARSIFLGHSSRGRGRSAVRRGKRSGAIGKSASARGGSSGSGFATINNSHRGSRSNSFNRGDFATINNSHSGRSFGR